ncbi:hypothetical protein Lcho_4074 [Leptothrix cholodnii SP-6]|uniref:Uncharacterized protein n=1 Tax=Leptothrix cholodnii (strain ATCC 51168 / LMG 8142 / SP-6) TaxID=395495 RepID=B1XWX7_LEPCP|nr:immunity 49 family protein [Leptothrix cholodnii]ACB36326.1 hypothetical protein Lcho_4074 [Leptothrix cholodnii SP-6]
MELADHAEALAYDTAFWLLGFEADEGHEVGQQGRASVELCAKLRALAIMALLTTGESDKFLHNLVRSGRVREAYLRRMKQAGRTDDHPLASGRMHGLIDAIASGDHALAHRIAWASPRSFQPRREYEDDFCCAQVLHRLVHGVQAASVYQPFFERYEAALEGQPSARLEVLRALVSREQARFDAAFEALLQERHDSLAADLARCQLETPQVVAERRVYIEGLALLRLAIAQGLKTERDYLYCPAGARLPMRTPVPEGPPAGFDPDADEA